MKYLLFFPVNVSRGTKERCIDCCKTEQVSKLRTLDTTLGSGVDVRLLCNEGRENGWTRQRAPLSF